MRSLRVVGPCLLAIILAQGCGPQSRPEPPGGKPGPVVSKIVSLSPDTSEILGELQLVDKMVGRTSSCNYPLGMKNVPIVVSGVKPDFEKIAKYKPQFVLYNQKLYANTDMEKLKETGATLFPMDVDTVQGLMDYILKVGSELNEPEKASSCVDKIYSAMETAKAAAPQTKVRVAILMPGTGEYMAAGTDSFLADVVKVCGGTLIGPPGKEFATVSMETLVAGNPQIVLTEETGAAKVAADPRLASIDAVKKSPRNVLGAPGDYLYRSGPRVAGLIQSLSNRIGQVGRGAGS
ncbi:MAG: ABC transporter substrate-binding protein [Armatimonadetes bacterium]|nr:ABC transporter substrate-binding protein [Armatimonadota bacterium]